MKIKTEFITNSSSSSFIVAWPYKIKTIKDIKEFIPEKYCKTVFHDAKQFKTLTIENPKTKIIMSKKMSEGYVMCHTIDKISYDEFIKLFCEREGITLNTLYDNSEWYAQAWEEREILTEIESGKHATSFIKELTKNHYIYIFTYGDEDGEYFSEMEHNGIFKKLKHIQVSHH